MRWLAVVLLALAGSGPTVLAAPCTDAAAPCPTPASTTPEREVSFRDGFGILASLELSSVVEVTSGAQPPAISNVSLVSGHFNLSYGRPRVRYFASLDLAVGATVADAGFAAELALLPIGIGLQLGRPERTAFIGVASGIGVSAAYPARPTVAVLPVQLLSVVRVNDKLNVIARARAAWFLNRTSRDGGAPSSSFWDELDGIVAIQRSRFHNYLDGYYVGAAYRELGDARFLGVVIGTGGGEEVFQE